MKSMAQISHCEKRINTFYGGYEDNIQIAISFTLRDFTKYANSIIPAKFFSPKEIKPILTTISGV